MTNKKTTKSNTKKTTATKKRTTAVKTKARTTSTPKTAVKTRANEAIEGAVCYLQEQLKKDGIAINDTDALVAVQVAARTTTALWEHA